MIDTDLAKHNEVLKKFQGIVDQKLDLENEETEIQFRNGRRAKSS